MDKNKTTVAIALLMMLVIAFSAVALPAVSAHNNDLNDQWVYQFYARISVAPDPVGVGESVLFVAAVDWALPGANYYNDVRPENIDIIVTAPDGGTTTFNFEVAPDSGGSAFVGFTPDQTGEYTVEAIYPDLIYHWNSSRTERTYYGDLWRGDTATNTFTVLEEPQGHVMVWPLPTEYWTRPIFGDNYNWDEVSSNWIAGKGTGGSSISTGAGEGNRWQQDGTAPRTAHIMWTKPIEFGGVTGGTPKDPAAVPQVWYSGMAYQVRIVDPIVIGGYFIYEEPLSGGGGGGGYTAVDIRTGEVKWHRDDIGDLDQGIITDFGSGNQHGTYGAIVFDSSGGDLVGYDAFTGKDAYTVEDVPGGYDIIDYTLRYAAPADPTVVEEAQEFQSTIYNDYTIYEMDYDRDTDTGWLALWSLGLTCSRGGISWNAGNRGTGSYSYAWNVSLPGGGALAGQRSPVILGVIPNDILVGTSSTVTLTYLPRQPETHDPYYMWAISLKPGSRGQLLWADTIDPMTKDLNLTRMTTMYPLDPVARVINFRDFNTNNLMGYDIDTHRFIWNTFPNGDPSGMNPEYRPLQWYSAREGMQAYGNFYAAGYGGEVFCYDNRNGTILWKYNSTNTADYTNGQPWGLQPLHMGAFADGMVFLFAGEHSPQTPLYTGYRNVVLNASTGEKVWDIFGWSSSGLGTSIPAMGIADGYMVWYNCFDGQLYSFGKGPSATTIAAAPEISVYGDKVLVKGTVMDIATGASQFNVGPRFPNGLPAVSDESMTPWMEYVYEQKPRPSDVVGVDVVLSVFDPNGNVYDIETVTGDADGNFHYVWDPLVPGEYTVVATFCGSESYWPSHASTSVFVEEAPEATPPPTPTPAGMTDTYVTGFGAAIIAVLIIGVVVIVLMLRRR